ncbi:MAG: Histidinol-phosphatase [Bacteroidota bacterium]|nr:Histidinol-phosphatase [Bacteroidota bacterium]
MKSNILLVTILLLSHVSHGQVRKEINIPDIPGYITLKGDFHMHTVFSDGRVWPTIRVQEAWRDGLDVIAITDHDNYEAFKEDVSNDDRNRPYEIARSEADILGITLIKGIEITKEVPPGHFNALFIKDANLLLDDDIFKTFREARNQGAYIQWNHPGYRQSKPIKWFDTITQLFENGLLDGIEVFSGRNFTPEAFVWAKERNLTITANSDMHFLTDMYHSENYHRPVTLVFAKDKSPEAVRESFMAGRTAAYFENTVVGKKEFLLPLFEASIEVLRLPLIIEKAVWFVQIKNNSDLDFEMELVRPVKGNNIPGEITLQANSTTLIKMNAKMNPDVKNITSLSDIKVKFKVNNLIVAPDEMLEVELRIPGIEQEGALSGKN